MLTLKNERELNTLGLKIHPGDPTKAIPLNEPTDSVPDKSWSLAHLGHFASVGLAEANRLDAEAVCLARKSTGQTFWAGCALTLAKPKVKGAGEKWTEWLWSSIRVEAASPRLWPVGTSVAGLPGVM